MITILQVISDTNIGGGGRSLLNYLRCQDRAEFRSHVALPRGSALAEPVRALDVRSMRSTAWRTAPWIFGPWGRCAG